MDALTYAARSPAERWMSPLLATLLVMLCLAVAMLSLSTPDYRRFALVAGGMEGGFGRESVLEQEPVPHGNAVVARSFYPEGEPVPVDAHWSGSGELPPLDLPTVAAPAPPAAPADPTPERLASVKAGVDALVARARSDAGALAQRFAAGIARGEVEIEARGRTTVLRFLESGSFAPGSLRLEPARRKDLEGLGPVLAADPGQFVLRGHHSGSRPGEASDWVLSASRAAAIAEALQAGNAALATRITVVAHGATRPPPGTRVDRANRVELVITQPLTPELAAALDTLRSSAPGSVVALDAVLDPKPAEVP